MHKQIKIYVLLIGIIFCTLSCTVVKPIQMIAHNQESMKLATPTIQKIELNFLSYREGASGANGGKTGGGCGCN